MLSPIRRVSHTVRYGAAVVLLFLASDPHEFNSLGKQMGIRGLLSLINSSNTEKMMLATSGDQLHVPTTLYIDIMNRILTFYHEYMHQHPSDADLDQLFQFIVDRTIEFISRLTVYNQTIFVFMDYKVKQAIRKSPLIYSDFILDAPTSTNTKITSYLAIHERTKCLPMLKRKYIYRLVTNQSPVFVDKLLRKVRCSYELKSIYGYADHVDYSLWVNVRYIIKLIDQLLDTPDLSGDTSVDIVTDVWAGKSKPILTVGSFAILQELPKSMLEEIKTILQQLVDETTRRYTLLRYSRAIQKRQRQAGLYSMFGKKEQMSGSYNKPLLKSYMLSTEWSKVDTYKSNIPFNVIIYAFPMIVGRIRQKLPNVSFFGCNMEADFAIAEHIRTYSNNSFPIIYTCDTDLLCLLCDVECIVELHNANGKYFINPPKFWRSVFHTTLPRNVIQILCVLMGTGTNPWIHGSCTHLERFDDILLKLGKSSFDELDEDELRTWLYVLFSQNPTAIEVKQTAISLNLYLNNIENGCYQLDTQGPPKENIERFLEYSHTCMF